MHRFKNVLYVTRGTLGGALESEITTLKHALRLTLRNQARLHALVVLPRLESEYTALQDEMQRASRQRVESSMEIAATTLDARVSDIALSLEVRSVDTPGIYVVQDVLRDGHDLVIKQVEPSELPGFRALDMELLRQCPCPVWLVRPRAPSKQSLRVAVAIDPRLDTESDRALSVRLLQLARSQADAGNGELHIIAVWDFPLEHALRTSPWGRLPPATVDQAVEVERRTSLETLHTLLDSSGIEGPHTIHHARGAPAETISRLTRELGVDLLVMGTVARVGIAGFVIGNTAENVVREVSCSLMALKPEGFVTAVRVSPPQRRRTSLKRASR